MATALHAALVPAAVANKDDVVEPVEREAARRVFEERLEVLLGEGDRARVTHVAGRRIDSTLRDVGDDRGDERVAQLAGDPGRTPSRMMKLCFPSTMCGPFCSMPPVGTIFDEARFSVRQENVREDLKQRNDDADSLLGREWDFLLYGKDHYLGRRMTSGHLDAITPDDLRDFHRRYWRPEHMVWSVSGDVDTAEILAMLEERLAAWPAADDAAAVDWPPPHEVPNPAPGIYHVEKDIPQGKVRIGNLAPRWDDWENPERAAIQVMDHILGASGFTSRIMRRVRSDEGLAYGAGGRFGFNPLGPSAYSMGYQSKSPTVALAAAIALEEVHRMRDEAVSPEELELAKRSLVDSFPRRFESAQARAGIFANDAFLERDHGYWVRWREQIEAVTAEDVVAVAQKYLRPDQMVMLVVGIWEDIGPGDPEGRAKIADILNGEVTHLPERDPLTLEVVPQGQ